MTRWLKRDGIVVAIFSALALVLTYPLLLYLDTHVPGHGIDDPALAWNLWWVKFSIFNLGTTPLTSDYVYYPVGVNFVAYTSTFLNGILSLPLQFVLGVIVSNNLIIYFALVAGGYGTFLLAREILARGGIRSDVAAAVAGAFYAFGAWHINYVVAGHFMLLSNEWIPFYALYLLRSDKQPWRSGALAGLFFVATAWTELTFIPFLALFTALYLVYRLVLARRPVRQTFSNLVALGGITALGVSPLLISLLQDFARFGYYLAPGLARVQVFSAEPVSFLVPSAAHPLLGAWANNLTDANTSYVFIGYAALTLAALGAVIQRRSRLAWFWAAVAVFFGSLTLGPTLIVGGASTGVPLPFALLREIPLVNANRYPVRFNVMLMFGLTPFMAFGAAALLRSRRGLLLGGLTLVLAFEQLVLPVPLTDLRAAPIFDAIRAEPGDFTVMDLPLGWRNSVAIQGKIDYAAQFLQTTHEKRLIVGLTSRNPAFKFQYYLEQPVLNSLITLENGGEIDDTRRAQDRAAAPEVLRFFDVRYVEVSRALTDRAVLDYALDVLPLTEIYRDDTRIVYRVDDLPPRAQAVDPSSETARLYFDDAWGRVQNAENGNAYRWATRGEAHLWLPLAPTDRKIAVRLMGARAGQAVTVRVNDRRVADIALSDTWQDYEIAFPDAVVRDGINDVAFYSETTPLTAARGESGAIGDTGVGSPVDIAATGAGFDAGRFGEIYVAGRNVIASRRGYQLAAVNAQTGAVDRVGSFDTFEDVAASERLAAFVAELPRGEIVAGVAVDEVSRRLQPVAVEALGQLGVETDLRYQFRTGQAFIGVKGALPGQAVEAVNGHFPANVAVGKNVPGDRIAFALAGIQVGQ